MHRPPITLKARIDKLFEVKEFCEQVGIRVADADVEASRKSILTDFLVNAPLAEAVVKGHDSYVERVRPIEERWGTYWKRMTLPWRDDAFDENVELVLGSINSVGVVRTYPPLFKVETRRNERKSGIKFITGCTALLTALLYATGNATPSDLPTLAGLSLAGTAALYGIVTVTSTTNLKLYSKELRQAAEITDAYLREQYRLMVT